MIPATTPTITIRRAYVRGFGLQNCLACSKKTSGKLCDHISGPFGNFYTSGIAICPRCYQRVKDAVEKAEGITLEGLR